MVKCSYCENQSNTNCSKCHTPVCSKHSHFKENMFDIHYEPNVAGHKYNYEVYCKDCDNKIISLDILLISIALILIIGFLLTILSMVI